MKKYLVIRTSSAFVDTENEDEARDKFVSLDNEDMTSTEITVEEEV